MSSNETGLTDTRIHHVKLAWYYFDDVCSGRKTFEVRINDRGYQTGDELLMREVSPVGTFTGRTVSARISYVHSGLGMDNRGASYVVLALQDVNHE